MLSVVCHHLHHYQIAKLSFGCLLKWAKCRQGSEHCHENLTFVLPEFMCVVVSPLVSAGGVVL